MPVSWAGLDILLLPLATEVPIRPIMVLGMLGRGACLAWGAGCGMDVGYGLWRDQIGSRDENSGACRRYSKGLPLGEARGSGLCQDVGRLGSFLGYCYTDNGWIASQRGRHNVLNMPQRFTHPSMAELVDRAHVRVHAGWCTEYMND